MLGVADLLRRCLMHLNRGDNTSAAAATGVDVDILRRDVETAARSLGAQHTRMSRDFGARSKTLFNAEFLIHCLIFSGWNRSVHDMSQALEDSIRITTPFSQHRHSGTNIYKRIVYFGLQRSTIRARRATCRAPSQIVLCVTECWTGSNEKQNDFGCSRTQYLRSRQGLFIATHPHDPQATFQVDHL